MKPQFVAANGALIPALGFGTFGVQGRTLSQVTRAALNSGFRHVDTAQVYGNEVDVGLGIAQSGISRNDIFVTAKVWGGNSAHRRMAQSVDESLRNLRSDHVDLLLLHWPRSEMPLEDQIGALNDVLQVGKARHIGLSTSNTELLERAIALSDVPLVTNQFEYNPRSVQCDLVSATRRAGLAVTTYFAKIVGRDADVAKLQEVAARNGRTASQVALRWLIQQGGTIALTRTINLDRLTEDAAVLDFELSPSDMAEVSALAESARSVIAPSRRVPARD